jgi:hypothetical protein
MQESCPYGSVRGAPSNGCPYRNRELGLRRGRRGIEQFRTHVDLTIQLGVGVEVAPIRRLLDVAEIVQIARGSSIRNTMLSVR